jgi:two-component system, OmpR family, alkaline phosphatase synthesis response regulator PhoP
MKILIVEDNPVNAEMLRVALQKEHYATVWAHDGQEALAVLEAQPDIDLVITDIMMPNVTGLEMLERIRQRAEWKTLPVVMATSLANQATVRQAVSLHCKHFIVKPFTVHLLLQTVRDAIGLRGVVLQEKPLVLGRLGLDAAGYDQLALAFATFVHERVTAFRKICERTQHEEIDIPMRRDLFAMEERLGALGLPGGTVAP